MMKIHIIGPSGSGKTTLAKALSERYGVARYDLDELCWDNSDGYGVKRDKAERDAMLADILRKPAWITEGVYYAWVGDCFRQADVIYLLEPPAWRCTLRILRRHIRRRLGLEKGKKETLRSVVELLHWTRKYRRESLPKIKKLLVPYEEKTVVVKS